MRSAQAKTQPTGARWFLSGRAGAQSEPTTPSFAGLGACCRLLEQVHILSPVDRVGRDRHSRDLIGERPRRDCDDDHRQRKNYREPKSKAVWFLCHVLIEPVRNVIRQRTDDAHRKPTPQDAEQQHHIGAFYKVSVDQMGHSWCRTSMPRMLRAKS